MNTSSMRTSTEQRPGPFPMPSCGMHRARRTEHGMVLLIVLGVLSVLMMFMLSMTITMKTEKQSSSLHTDLTQSRLLAESAIERAVNQIRTGFGDTIYPADRFYTPGTGAWAGRSYLPSIAPGLTDGIAQAMAVRLGGRQFTPESPIHDDAGWHLVRSTRYIQGANQEVIIGRYSYLIIDESGKLDPGAVVSYSQDETEQDAPRTGVSPSDISLATAGLENPNALRPNTVTSGTPGGMPGDGRWFSLAHIVRAVDPDPEEFAQMVKVLHPYSADVERFWRDRNGNGSWDPGEDEDRYNLATPLDLTTIYRLFVGPDPSSVVDDAAWLQEVDNDPWFQTWRNATGLSILEARRIVAAQVAANIVDYADADSDPTAVYVDAGGMIRQGAYAGAYNLRGIERNWGISELAIRIETQDYQVGDDESGHAGGDTVAVSGQININPNNSPHMEFYLIKPDGSQVTRDDMHAFGTDYQGPATRVHVKPKGNGNQNSLLVDGEPFILRNRDTYDIISEDMTVRLYNSRRNAQGKAMGQWWIEISANEAVIIVNDKGYQGGRNVTFVVDGGRVVPSDSYTASVKVLGAAIENWGYHQPVTARVEVGNQAYAPWGPYNSPVDANLNDGNNPRDYVLPGAYSADTPLSLSVTFWKKINANSSGALNSHWTVSREVCSNPSNVRVKALRDGDPVPNVPGFQNQQGLEYYVANYVSNGKIVLTANQVIYLFEHTSDLNSSGADYQDCVVLVTLAPAEVSVAVPGPPVIKSNGGGFFTEISSVTDNGNGTHTIVLTVSHDGSKPSKELSHFAIEAALNTYSGVGYAGISGSIDMGHNLGASPFKGFKLDGLGGIGDGKAGSFTVSYTLSGGLQAQRTSAKAATNTNVASFSVADFESVLGTVPGEEPAFDFAITGGRAVPTGEFYVNATVLGASIVNWGYAQPVTARITIGSEVKTPWGSYTSPVTANLNDGKNPRTVEFPDLYPAGTPVTATCRFWKKKNANSSGNNNNHWEVSREVDSQANPERVIVLRDGDPVPDVPGFQNQQSLAYYVQDYVVNGRMALHSNQVIYLFEHTPDLNSAGADFQDLVVLVTLVDAMLVEPPPPSEPENTDPPVVSTGSALRFRTGLRGQVYYPFASGADASNPPGELLVTYTVEVVGATGESERATVTKRVALDAVSNNDGGTLMYSSEYDNDEWITVPDAFDLDVEPARDWYTVSLVQIDRAELRSPGGAVVNLLPGNGSFFCNWSQPDTTSGDQVFFASAKAFDSLMNTRGEQDADFASFWSVSPNTATLAVGADNDPAAIGTLPFGGYESADYCGVDVRDAPFTRVGELGRVHSYRPTRSLRLWSASAADESGHDAAMLDMFRVKSGLTARGKVNINTLSPDVLTALFTNVTTVSAQSAVQALLNRRQGGVAFTNIGDPFGAVAGLSGGNRGNDRQEEDAVARLVELLTVRQNYFTVIATAQAIRDVAGRSFASGSQGRTAQFNQFDVERDAQGNVTRYVDPILAEQKVKAVVYRDAFSNRTRVEQMEFVQE